MKWIEIGDTERWINANYLTKKALKIMILTTMMRLKILEVLNQGKLSYFYWKDSIKWKRNTMLDWGMCCLLKLKAWFDRFIWQSKSIFRKKLIPFLGNFRELEEIETWLEQGIGCVLQWIKLSTILMKCKNKRKYHPPRLWISLNHLSIISLGLGI